MSATITIPIPETLATVYKNASQADQQKAQWLVEFVLRDLFEEPRSLTEVIHEISENAAKRGLTSEILEELF